MADASNTVLQGLIDRLAAGDAAARRELIGRACGRLRHLTLRMFQDFTRLHRWEEPDDVLQNALIRLMRALEAVPPANVAQFFRLAARHIRCEMIDLARHHFGPEGLGAAHATPQGGSRADSQSLPAHANEPETTWEPGKLAAWTEFHSQVEALPRDERDVFELLWYHGMTQDEAAATLQISLATVKRRWAAARLRLQPALLALA